MIEWKVIGLKPEMLQSIYDAIGECFQYIQKEAVAKHSLCPDFRFRKAKSQKIVIIGTRMTLIERILIRIFL